MVGRPGAIIARMPNAMFMHSHGIRQHRVEHMKLVEVVQRGVRMAGRPGSVLILVAIDIIPGAWLLILTIPIVGLFRPVRGRGKRITREGTRKPISMAWQWPVASAEWRIASTPQELSLCFSKRTWTCFCRL